MGVSINGVVHRIRFFFRPVPGYVMRRCCSPPDICTDHRYWLVRDLKTYCDLETWTMELPEEGEVTCLSCLACS